MTQLLPPSPDNDYQFPAAPNRAVLDRAVWAAVMASIGGRLRGLEDQRTELADVIADLRMFGLERLNTAIEPLIVQTQQRLDGLDADLAVLRGQIDTILSGVVPAGIVAESETRVFVTPEQRAEIAVLRNELDTAKVADIDPGPMAESRSLRVRRGTKAELDAAKAEGDLKVGELVLVTDEGTLAMALAADEYVYAAPVAATRAQAEAGVDEASYITPQSAHWAVAARLLGLTVVYEKITISGTFTKHPGDILYFVHVVAGSGGSGTNANGAASGGTGGASSFGDIVVSGGFGGASNSNPGGGGSGGLGSVGGSFASGSAGIGGMSGGPGGGGLGSSGARGGSGSPNYRGVVIMTPHDLGATTSVVVGSGGTGAGSAPNGGAGFVEIWRVKK